MKVYVVVSEINAYDQEGQYFESVHSTYESALKSVDHIGRENLEYKWYDILEVNVIDK